MPSQIASNISSSQPTILPRNSLHGLPLELRQMIYCSLLDDLTAEPQHPYSVLPLSSRFSSYVALLLVDKTTSQEVQGVFAKKYAEEVVFYFEDAYSLVELMQASESNPALRDLRFVLRNRTDVGPEHGYNASGPEHGYSYNGFVGLNEAFLCHLDSARGKTHGTANIIPPSSLNDPIIPGLTWFFSSPSSPSSKYEAATVGDHSWCGKSKEPCMAYESVKIPEMIESLSADLAFWKVPKINKEQEPCSEESVESMKYVGILLFRGRIRDIFWEGFYRHASLVMRRSWLIAFLVSCPWPEMRALYRGKYPCSIQEWHDCCAGKVDYGWTAKTVNIGYVQLARTDLEYLSDWSV